MSESKWVTCGAHGKTPATFACRHVTRGSACGFHASADKPDDEWPDAWCDLCEEAFQAAGGEWNDTSEKGADVQLMCTHCYEAARTRNRHVPRFAKGTSARLTEAEASTLIHHAVHELQAVQAKSEKRWGWGHMADWHFDDAARTLTFSDPTRGGVVADVRLVGSYSTNTGTFQWAWETFDEGAIEAKEISRMRVFGEVRGVSVLRTPNWKCEEAVGWEMAAIAGYILGADGLYRAPFDHQRWFMLLSNWRDVN